jgi:DNA polymerase-3 subunit delta'
MPLPPIAGHEDARALFARALVNDALPQSILIHGPPGVGKERLGLWLAQAIVCEARVNGEPCGVCNACRLATRLEHPDIHWFFPLPRPEGASSPEKLGERLEEMRAEELQRWRDKPLRTVEYDKAPAHFLAAVRTMQRIAGKRPATGENAVFVIGDAELMVPQEASQEAANAFLKLLEEPPVAATIILTTSQIGALLPTIRSRVFAVRTAPVPAPELARLLVEEKQTSPEAAAEAAGRARGSVRRAVRALTEVSGAPDAERAAGRELLIAALTSGSVSRLAAANSRAPSGGRATLAGELDSFGLWLRDLAAVCAGSRDQVADPDALTLLDRAVSRRGVTPDAVIRSMNHLLEARQMALGNVNPQLIVADLLAKVQRELIGAAAAQGGGR